jgi:hypothetical protein
MLLSEEKLMTYTTQELITFLEYELCATWKGERIIFSATEKIDNPVIAKAIDVDKAGKVFVYRDFRNQIHEYQRQHQVSGIIGRTVAFQDKSIHFPELHNQLIEIEGDKQILINAKESVLNFWRDVTTGMKYYLSRDRHNQISIELLEELYQEAEWAEVDVGLEEVYLGLCWGNLSEYIYEYAKPESGCHRIIATRNKPSSINI